MRHVLIGVSPRCGVWRSLVILLSLLTRSIRNGLRIRRRAARYTQPKKQDAANLLSVHPQNLSNYVPREPEKIFCIIPPKCGH